MKSLSYLLFLFAFTIATALAQAPRTTAPEDPAKRLGRLEGQILNQVTGEPVRKANLTLRPESGGTNLKAATD